MKFEILKTDLSMLYMRAKESFKECIHNEANDFLKGEINLAVEDIIIVENNIKVVFSKRSFESYLFEITLSLFEGSKEIGKYLYIKDEKREAVDDRLVFY